MACAMRARSPGSSLMAGRAPARRTRRDCRPGIPRTAARVQRRSRSPLQPPHHSHLEGVREELVPRIGADPVLELATHLGGDLQHETMLVLLGHEAFPFEAVAPRFLFLLVLRMAPEQQLNDHVLGFEAVQVYADLQAQALTVGDIARWYVQPAQGEIAPLAAHVRLPGSELACRLE